MTTAQFSVNTLKTVRPEIANCNGYFEVVTCLKRHNEYSDCFHTPESNIFRIGRWKI